MKNGLHSKFATPENLTGKRVTVVGLGRFGGGVGAASWLCSQGAIVTVTDAAPADALEESIAQLSDLEINFDLGGHSPESFTQADLLVVSPAIPPQMPLLKQARQAGKPITTEINLFIERCPCKIVAITGSVGKSTTTAMVGEVLKTRYRTHVGGNIGKSLLPDLDKISADDIAVLEISSFQLEYTREINFRPDIALVTNLIPNHLDRHETMENYSDAKQNIFRFQVASDLLILNAVDDAIKVWASDAPSRVEFFSPDDDAFDLAIPGLHNQANAQATWAIAKSLGISRHDTARALGKFPGLIHRLEFVCENQLIKFFNDSKCTTPTGAVVALNAFAPGKTILLAGGYDKKVSFAELAQTIATRAKAVIAFGQVGAQIAADVKNAPGFHCELVVENVDTLEEAFAGALKLSAPGDNILLSPACASYDQFTNYQQRGELFRKLVKNCSKF